MDDVEDNREVYATYFEWAGFIVDRAVDGADALAKVKHARPDVIVMDLSMPNMDGWAATEAIKKNPKTSKIPVIVVTGYATVDELQRARKSGADDVCAKPCLPKDLHALIQRMLTTTTSSSAR